MMVTKVRIFNKVKAVVILSAITFVLTACEESKPPETYVLKDVIVDKKEEESEYRSSDNFFIIIKNDDRKARIELSEDNYERMVEGQHIDVEINKETGVLHKYQINMDGDKAKEETKLKGDTNEN